MNNFKLNNLSHEHKCKLLTGGHWKAREELLSIFFLIKVPSTKCLSIVHIKGPLNDVIYTFDDSSSHNMEIYCETVPPWNILFNFCSTVDIISVF